MAKLYGSMAGARTTGLVGHDEMITQVQTWKGCARLWMDENGNFELYVADEKGENGIKVVEGNANRRTVQDAGGGTLSVAPLSTTLDPIVVKNRGKQYTKQQQAAGQVPPTRPPVIGRTKKAQVGKRIPAAKQQMPSQRAAQAKAAKAGRKTRPAGSPRRQQPQGPPGFDARKFKVGDLVVLKHTEDPKYPVNVNTQGVIDKIRMRSPLGPQVVVDWNIHGAATIYPNNGDVIEKVK